MIVVLILGLNEIQYVIDDCFEEIINNIRVVRQDFEKIRFKLQINNFFVEVVSGFLVINSDLIGSIEKWIVDIDKLMFEQFSLIMYVIEF